MKPGIVYDQSLDRHYILGDGGVIGDFRTHQEAEQRLKELEAQTSEEVKQKHQAKSEPAKPTRRRRSIKVYDWMRRATNKEENWRLGDPEGYQAAADTIAKIKAGAPEIKDRYPFRDYYPIEEYGFKKPFDLADRLIGLLKTYKRNEATLPKLKERINEGERRLAEIRKTGTLANARSEEIFALFVAGYKLHDPDTHRLRDPVTNREKHALQKAIRQAMQAPRKEGGAGRYPSPERALARGLAGTYYLGTGKRPVTGTRGQFRGPYARFAHECLALLNIEVTDATLRDQAGKMRDYFKKREEERSRAHSKREN